MNAVIEVSGIPFNVKVDTSIPRIEKVEFGGFDFTKLIYDNEIDEFMLDKVEPQIKEFNRKQQEDQNERIREFYER